MLKELKPSKLSVCYQTVSVMHQSLMREVHVDGSPTSVLELESYLPSDCKQQIAQNVKGQYVRMMNILNRTTKDVLDLTTTYRAELGFTIQKVLESYNSVFIQLLKTSCEREAPVEKMMYEEKLVELEKEK